MPNTATDRRVQGGAPSVSVIMPMYNAAEVIVEAIESVIAQTYTDWELVVADDCSSDDSVALVKAMAQSDARIRLIELDKNVGSTGCRNAALQAARGRFMAFLDGDDIWLPHKLEMQIPLLRDGPHALCCSSYEVMSHTGRKTGRVRKVAARTYSYASILKNNVIGCLTSVVDTQKTGPLYVDPAEWVERSRGDYVLWLNALQNGRTAIGVKDVLALYRLSRNSVSSRKIMAAGGMWRVLRHNRKLPMVVAMGCFASYAIMRLPRVFERFLTR
ncbi:MAG: glycosyltransferase [Alphaproteobacteria bacterium]|nr:MAG: glycosyltransferase [Alphaproteobacteria bacterium]